MLYRETKPDNCGIYAIKNVVNGKLYIGQSHNISWRWMSHKCALRKNRCSNRHLQFAWNKYGEESFEFIILELCDMDILDNREEFWIKKFDTTNMGYNIRGGGNSSRGWKMSEDGKRHISESLRGKKKPDGIGKKISKRQKEYYQTHIPANSKLIICLNTGEIFANGSKVHDKYPVVDISALHNQCKGKTKSCGKMENGEHLVWAYIEDYNEMTKDEIDFRLQFVGRTAAASQSVKPVQCLNTGTIFTSCKEAAEYAGISSSTIHDCLSGRQNHAGKHPETRERLSWAWASV